eukprot:10163811-Prorocentrum_lima.AAC.1
MGWSWVGLCRSWIGHGWAFDSHGLVMGWSWVGLCRSWIGHGLVMGWSWVGHGLVMGRSLGGPGGRGLAMGWPF